MLLEELILNFHCFFQISIVIPIFLIGKIQSNTHISPLRYEVENRILCYAALRVSHKFLRNGNPEYNETGKERTYVWWNAGSCNELPYVMSEPIKRHF